MQHPYKRLGGWFGFLVWAQLAATVLLAIIAVVGVFPLLGYISYIGALAAFMMLIMLAAWAVCAVFAIRFFIMVRNRDPRFMRFYEIVYLVTLIATVAMIIFESSYFGALDSESIRNLISSFIGFLIWTAYFRRSVRVRTYMGGDEYLRRSIFSKNAPGPQPAVPDAGGDWQPPQPPDAYAARQNEWQPPQPPAEAAAPQIGGGYAPPASVRGSAAPQSPPDGQGEIPPGWEIEPVCPKCGNVNPESKFCRVCGEKLAIVKLP